MAGHERAINASRSGAGRSLAGYHLADSFGHFPPGWSDEDPEGGGTRRIDYDEIDHDPSERKAGAFVAEAALRDMPAGLRRTKWMLPALAFVAALLVQSVGLYLATRRYVLWIGRLEEQDVPLASPYVFVHLHPRDNFAAWLGAPIGPPEAFADFLAWCVPLAWLVLCERSRSLRVWTRTLLAGSALALLKGFFAWATPVPDSSGWGDCRERIEPRALLHFKGGGAGTTFLSFMTGVLIVFRIWILDIFTGMRGHQDVMCTNSFSGPTYTCALFSLGVFDILRTRAHKLKPFFRTCAHIGLAVFLSLTVLFDAYADLAQHKQYTIDVAVAIVLALLLYSSPVLSLVVHVFVYRGASRVYAEQKDRCDVGDVLVPPCCLPFCCMHGRYFLYTRSAEEVDEMFRSQREAAKVVEELRDEEAETHARLVDLEAEVSSVRQQAEAHERRESADREARLARLKAEARQRQQGRISKGLAHYDDNVAAEKIGIAEFESMQQAKAGMMRDAAGRLEQDIQRLVAELNAAREEAAEAARLAESDKVEDGFSLIDFAAANDICARLGESDKAEDGFSLIDLAAPDDVYYRPGDLLATPPDVQEALPILGVSSAEGIHATPDGRDFDAPDFGEALPVLVASSTGNIHDVPNGHGVDMPDLGQAWLVLGASPTGQGVSPRRGLAREIIAQGDFRSAPTSFWARLHARFAVAPQATSALQPSTPAVAASSAAPPPPAEVEHPLPFVAAAVAAAPLAPLPSAAVLPASPPGVRLGAPDLRMAPAAYWVSLHARFDHRPPAASVNDSARCTSSAWTDPQAPFRAPGPDAPPQRSGAALGDGYPEQPFQWLPSVGPSIIAFRARRGWSAAADAAALEAKAKAVDKLHADAAGFDLVAEADAAIKPSSAGDGGDTCDPSK